MISVWEKNQSNEKGERIVKKLIYNILHVNLNNYLMDL